MGISNKWKVYVLCLVAQSSLTLRPHDSPGKNTGVGCHALLQGIFPTQGSNWGLLHCRRILYQLSYQGSTMGHQGLPQLRKALEVLLCPLLPSHTTARLISDRAPCWNLLQLSTPQPSRRNTMSVEMGTTS